MPVAEAIRAWKDEDYFLSLSEEERAVLPASPVGDAEFDSADVADAAITVFKACQSIVIECSASNCG